MAGLTGPRWAAEKTIKTKLLPFGAGLKAWRGGMACLDTNANVVKPGAAGNANLVNVGQFEQDFDNSAGTGSVFVNVTLAREINCQWYDNATGGAAITASQLFQDVYILDDHTVTNSSSGNSKAGRVWEIDTLLGVLIQPDQL